MSLNLNTFSFSIFKCWTFVMLRLGPNTHLKSISKEEGLSNLIRSWWFHSFIHHVRHPIHHHYPSPPPSPFLNVHTMDQVVKHQIKNIWTRHFIHHHYPPHARVRHSLFEISIFDLVHAHSWTWVRRYFHHHYHSPKLSDILGSHIGPDSNIMLNLVLSISHTSK